MLTQKQKFVMSFLPIEDNKEVIENAIETVKAAPLVYSNPLNVITSDTIPEKSEEVRLEKSIVEYLNGVAYSSIDIYIPFANGGVSNTEEEKRPYLLEGSYAESGNEYQDDFTEEGAMKKMYAAITMIASRSHMISLALNDVPQSYYFSNLYDDKKHKKTLSANIYRRLYVTDCVKYQGARGSLLSSRIKGLKACYCAIITLNTDIGSDDSIFTTTTRLIIADKGEEGTLYKGHIDKLIKDHIFPAIENALKKVFDIEIGGSFESQSELEDSDIMDIGLISIRRALDDIGGTGRGNEIEENNTGKYLKVLLVDADNQYKTITPLIAMLMASHAGDEYLDSIVSNDAIEWSDKNLKSKEYNWYALVTSMLLRGLSPFYEYDSSKPNSPLEAAPISYDQREEIKEILKITKEA